MSDIRQHPGILQALGGFPPTDEQWTAISHPPTPLGIIAGAGSGKTAVMAARITHLVLTGRARASEVLGLTFTNKAAQELSERVRRCLAVLDLPVGEEATILTYNSFADRLLRDFGPKIGVEPDVALLSEAQAYMLLSRLLEEMTFDHLEVRSTNKPVRNARSLADACANHLVEPERVIEADAAMKAAFEASDKRIPYRLADVLRDRPEIARLVRAYLDRKKELGRIDYGDQIAFACRIVSELPDVAATLRHRWPHVLLDEYQDTNVAQQKMMSAIYPAGSAITVVGDPDQAIYGWRGATLHNILRFPEHFATADGSPATTLPLETSFRSGLSILQAAEAIISSIPSERRGGEKRLLHHEPRGAGEVTLDLLDSEIDEAELIAEEIAAFCGIEDKQGSGLAGEPLPYSEVAVLCRKRRLYGRIGQVLRDKGIPVEVVGLGGLMTTPEVNDLLAYLKSVVRPGDNIPFARIAMGPRWRIHFRDISACARWAAANTGKLAAQLQERDQMEGEVDPGEERFSLSEALGRLDEIEDLSGEARQRLTRLHAELEQMRRDVRGLTLGEAVEHILVASGIDDELLASGSKVAGAARANLASFLDAAVRFAPLEGEASLGTFLEYLEAAEGVEDIEVAQPRHDDSVKLMTVHQAKGLEFDLVYLPGMAKRIFPDDKVTDNPAKSVGELPYEVRTDRESLPSFDKVMSRFESALRERAMEEERRLAYVAITRARKSLRMTAAHWYGEERVTPAGPGLFFEELAGKPATDEDPGRDPHPAVTVRRNRPRPEENPLRRELVDRARHWPPGDEVPDDTLFPEGWRAAFDAVRAGRIHVDDMVEQNRVDRDAFVEAKARRAEQLELVTRPAPEEKPDERLKSLSVSSMVQMARCPKQFYWTVVRPLPRRPSAAARLGHEIHRWIEIRSIGQQRLDDPEDLPDMTPEEVTESATQGTTPSGLKRSFETSRFATTRPRYTEQPFVIALEGGFLVRGRIDAVYVSGDEWELVDYKTGREPEAGDATASMQLAIYALAAQKIWGVPPEKLKVTYFYLKTGNAVTSRASDLDLTEGDLIGMFRTIESGDFEPVPTPICHYCDFRQFCEAGKAYVASGSDDPASGTAADTQPKTLP